MYIDFCPYESDSVLEAGSMLIVLFLELVACWFLFVKLVARWFFPSLNSFISFISPRNWFFFPGTLCVQIFFPVRAAYCFLTFVHETCHMLIFSSWNLYIDFSNKETVFFYGTCYLLISYRTYCAKFFVNETCFTLILYFVKLLHWFFPLEKLILFIKLFSCWFFLFLELSASFYLFVKIVAWRFFLFVKLVNWFLSS